MTKIKKSPEQLVHMTRGLEALLILGPDEWRIKALEQKGFEVVGYYRLSRTGGDLAIALPKTGVFACAYSALCTSPWRAPIKEET